MNHSYGYHQNHDDGDDSDLELDLEELAPGISTGFGVRERDLENEEIPLHLIGDGRRRGKHHNTSSSLGSNLAEGVTYGDGDGVPLLHSQDDNPIQGQTASSFADRLRLSRLIGRQYNHTVPPVQMRIEEEENLSNEQRVIEIGATSSPKYPQNAISNAKYTPWNFVPLTLWQEFRFFINMYFLAIALSQLIPPLQIGRLWTYFAPLAFVLSISMGKEAFDDVTRRRRDTEANNELYTMLALRGARQGRRSPARLRQSKRNPDHHRFEELEQEEIQIGHDGGGRGNQAEEISIRARDIKVGDVLVLRKNQRVPADVVILKTVIQDVGKDTNIQTDEEGNGEAFIRTDQLDGETDWKLRIANPLTQSLDSLAFSRVAVTAAKPSRKVNDFVGNIELQPEKDRTLYDQAGGDTVEADTLSAALNIDHTAWANTVIASSATVYAVVIYTGSQTRQAMSTSSPRSKVGLLELEVNDITKVLCVLTLLMSAVMAGLQYLTRSPENPWYISIFRFLILFSVIIPISLRMNLDLAKTVYARFINTDKDISGAVVRTSTIPEDLGRIEYLLSDKTGTLTQNEMDMRKIHIGTVSFANEAMEEVAMYISQAFATDFKENGTKLMTPSSLSRLGSAANVTRTRREISGRVRDIVLALALCHNVTPTVEEVDNIITTSYQASSPDEIAIVKWTESVGLRLAQRDRHNIVLENANSGEVVIRVKILEMFPFTSDSKRMSIILQYLENDPEDRSRLIEGEIWFYQKGADTVMTKIVASNDWLDEETANMAREGLRTLVVGRRKLSKEQYAAFTDAYRRASTSLQDRDSNMAMVVASHLEQNLELLGVTGVEDKLQQDVKPSLELLRNAGIKIWMLTGDKVETARCVAVSSKLVSRTQTIQTITSLHKLARSSLTAATDALAMLSVSQSTTALLIDGDSLSYLIAHHRTAFITTAVRLPVVIACRCSPAQKADIAHLIRSFTGKRVACIGDGGNDVSMIQAADVGVGIVGKEGRQASLAADFSITQFHHLSKLLVWHGRNSYKRSAKLAQFVMHRGLLLAIAQLVFSLFAGFTSEGLVVDWLLIGYATMYTQLPIFSFVLDTDVDERLARLYPELYKELITKGKEALSYRTAGIWLAVTVYQGLTIQLLAQVFAWKVSDIVNVGGDMERPRPNHRMLAVSYTSLILNELLMVAVSITSWRWPMVAAIVFTALLYGGSVPFLETYFDLSFVWSWSFAWRVVAISAASIVPTYLVKIVGRTIRPPSYRKVRGV